MTGSFQTWNTLETTCKSETFFTQLSFSSKQQKAKLKEGNGSGQFNFLKEKVMSLEDNSEDEDYEAAATKRVQEAV